jgi:hypothetical protein
MARQWDAHNAKWIEVEDQMRGIDASASAGYGQIYGRWNGQSAKPLEAGDVPASPEELQGIESEMQNYRKQMLQREDQNQPLPEKAY